MCPNDEKMSGSGGKNSDDGVAPIIKKEEKKKEEIPLLAAFWCKVYDAAPKVYAGKNNTMDVGFSLVVIFIFILLRKVILHILYSMGWPSSGDEHQNTLFVEACFIGGIFHTPLLVPVLFVLLRSQPFIPSASITEHPVWYQKTTSAMLQLCTGFMIYDFGITLWDRWDKDVGYPVLNEDDPLYMLHHFMTAFYMVTTTMIGAGQASAMICMFLGECTNPFFNLHLVFEKAVQTGFCCSDGSIFQKIRFVNEILTAISYVSVRGFIAPCAIGIYTCYGLLFPKNNIIPFALRITYCILIWGVLFGSIGWVKILSMTLMNHFNTGLEMVVNRSAEL
mmetsp:Transcript_26150/g.29907  ORF Transcript_26150/g.29907 Transcript_26150/m.29907 type:complete len:335 (+) Transcript_26150:64-1068(+)